MEQEWSKKAYQRKSVYNSRWPKRARVRVAACIIN